MYTRQRLHPRQLRSPDALSGDDVRGVLSAARQLRHARADGRGGRPLHGRNLALLYRADPPHGDGSLRSAALGLGAAVAHLRPEETRLDSADLAATARVLGRLYDAIDCESLAPETIEAIAREAGVPVYDGLGLAAHPVLVLGEWLAMQERCAKPLERLKVCYLGDADNPCADALLQTASVAGVDLRLCAPPARWPPAERLDLATRRAAGRAARLFAADDASGACADADIVIDGRGGTPWRLDGIGEAERRDCRHVTLQALLLATLH